MESVLIGHVEGTLTVTASELDMGEDSMLSAANRLIDKQTSR